MPVLYRRQIRTQVAGLTISELRQKLSIERHSDPTQNRGALSIYNLAPAHEMTMFAAAATISERGENITIEAGYPDTTALVFEGEVQRVRRSRERTARITQVTLGDQIRHKDRLGGVSNRVYPGVEPVRMIATDLIEDMGLEPGPLDAIPEFATFADFHWAGAPAAAGLRALLDGARPSLAHIRWYESDGVVRFSAPGEPQMDAPTIVLSPDTGLIESPVETDEGAAARSFLNPAITVGCLIDLQSETVNGLWKVVALRHTGDTWSGEFETGVDMRREGEGRVEVVEPPPLPETAVAPPTGPTTGSEGGTPRTVGRGAPNRLSVVQRVAADNPAALMNSCQSHGGSWDFMDQVVGALRAESPRWGYNLKRGGPDLSEDAIAYYRGDGSPDGSFDVAIVDIIGGHCGGNPTPAWIDQTAATARAGSVGRWRFPR